VVGFEWYPCCRLKQFGRIVLGSMCVRVSVWLGLSGIHVAGKQFGRIVLGSMCVGVSVWLGLSGILVAG